MKGSKIIGAAVLGCASLLACGASLLACGDGGAPLLGSYTPPASDGEQPEIRLYYRPFPSQFRLHPTFDVHAPPHAKCKRGPSVAARFKFCALYAVVMGPAGVVHMHMLAWFCFGAGAVRGVVVLQARCGGDHGDP